MRGTYVIEIVMPQQLTQRRAYWLAPLESEVWQ
jgi:hypothetical protein